MGEAPRLLLTMVCGSNGAGKSTMTYGRLEQIKQQGINIPFIDPDRIAKEHGCSPVEAGKITSREVKSHIKEGISFLKESTLTSKFDFDMIKLAKANGFKVDLIYVGISSVEDAVLRVQRRHEAGGHTVPSEDIKRRYQRSLDNLPKAIGEVDTAIIIDNSTERYKEVAKFEKGKMISHTFTPKWFEKPLEQVQQQQKHKAVEPAPKKRTNQDRER